MNSKMSKISLKSFHYNPLTFSIVSSEKHMCPVFFRAIFTCFLNNRFCSEGRGKEIGGVLLSCLIFFWLVKAACNCFEEHRFSSILQLYTSNLTWEKIILDLKISIYLFSFDGIRFFMLTPAFLLFSITFQKELWL